MHNTCISTFPKLTRPKIEKNGRNQRNMITESRNLVLLVRVQFLVLQTALVYGQLHERRLQEGDTKYIKAAPPPPHESCHR